MKKYILSFIFAFVLLFGAVNASAVNLLIETTDSSGAEKTTFAPGDELWVNILVDVQTDIAGVAFTLIYNDTATVLNPPTTDGEGVSADVSSPFDFFSYDDGTALTDTHRANSTTTAGKLMFSGAAINQSNGGGRTASSSSPIFRAKFMVDTSAVEGTYNLTLDETTLNNSAAGWNGEQSPVLVGALTNSDTNYGGDLSDDFPILLSVVNSTASYDIVQCVKGDVDGIAGIDLKDVRYILYSYYEFTGYPIPPGGCGDVDGISGLDLKDVRHLLYHYYEFTGYETLY